jgi:hypothetical protein
MINTKQKRSSSLLQARYTFLLYNMHLLLSHRGVTMCLLIMKKAISGMVKVSILAGALVFYSSAAHTEIHKILKCSHIISLNLQ